MRHIALYLLGWVIVILGALVAEGVRRILTIAPRYICALRLAQSAWAAWDEPAIAERRKAVQARALAEQRALECALIEAAYQKEAAS